MATEESPDTLHALLVKIEQFNSVLEETRQNTAKITTALYDPDEGLFARIKASSDEARVRDEEIRTGVSHLEGWRQTVDRDMKDVKALIDKVKELEGWKSRTMSLAKWFIGVWTSTSVAVLGKLIYDLFHDHVRFI